MNVASELNRPTDRYRLLLAIIVIEGLAMIVGGVLSYLAVTKANDAAADAHNSLVVICKNGNDFRDANLAFWTFLIGQSKADTPAEGRALAKIQRYAERTFRQHDCEKLDKKYPIPKAPKDLGLD
jgi:hypothetical protein